MAFGRKGVSRTPAHPPHWMRQLEEKYQRLHAKIASQSGRYSSRRQPGPTGKNVNTPRLSADTQPFNSTKERITERGEAGEESHDSRHGHRHREDCSESRSEESVYEGTNGTLEFTGSDSGNETKRFNGRFGNKDITACTEDLESCLGSELVAVSELEVSRNFGAPILGSPGHVLTQEDGERRCDDSSRVSSTCLLPAIGKVPVLSEVEERDDDVESNVVFRVDYSPKVSVPDIEDAEHNLAGAQTQAADMEVSEYQLRKRENLHFMKKSDSRNSHKTTKSCPATLGAVTTREITGSHGVTGSLEDVCSSRNLEFPFGRGFSHKSRSNVFARMSLEARHAIDETLREMKAEEEQQQMNDGMGRTLLLPTDDEADHTDKDIETNEQLTVTSQHGLNKTTPANDNDDDNLAGNNVRKTLNATYPADNVRTRTDYLGGRMSTNRKLPQLDFGAISPSGFPNAHQRLPDIGQPYEPVHYEPVHYEPVHFRENTFEITPVDFDIRFHQIIPCSPGDSPPPDIRQQSIEKCQQWLVRHTPRH